MHENRTSYPQKKVAMYQQLQELPKRYKVISIVKMDKVRSAQILPLRKTLKGDVEFVNMKSKIAKKALATLDIPGIREIADELVGQCMFIFTNMSPFKLNLLLSKNTIMMAARGGDTASIDVVVPAKNTGIAPGPMLTEFKEAGIPTKIDQGTIWISKDTTPVTRGEVISEQLASILGKLDIKPVEAGILLYSALEDGIKYATESMVIDVSAVQEEFSQAHQQAISLSIEIAYVVPENIVQILTKAATAARSVSIESAYIVPETHQEILQRALAHANAIINKTGYTAN